MYYGYKFLFNPQDPHSKPRSKPPEDRQPEDRKPDNQQTVLGKDRFAGDFFPPSSMPNKTNPKATEHKDIWAWEKKKRRKWRKWTVIHPPLVSYWLHKRQKEEKLVAQLGHKNYRNDQVVMIK